MSETYTTAGAIKLKHSMPNQESKDRYPLYTPLDKKGVKDVVNMLLLHGGHEATDRINDLGKLFFNTATEIGASTPLTDYINDSDERQAIVDEFETKANAITMSGLPEKERDKKLRELTGAYNTKIAKQNLDYLVAKGSMAARMAKTGARGNPSQLASGTSTPLMSFNVKGEMIPVVIKSSFAKGMTPAEQIALSYMGRGSTVLAQLSTSLPGALFKRLSPTTFHEVITLDNCKTHNGIYIPVSDSKSVIGRFLADTDQLIDEAVYASLKRSGAEKVKVRSSMTCEAKNGICQHCYGLWANGKLPNIGTNVGVVAAQSVSEVLTQAMLSTKHKASVGERKGNAYEQAANILNNPADNFKDEATISSVNGVVSRVHKTPLGDHQVFIDDTLHFVPNSQGLLVGEGKSLKKGDRVSTGTINPRKLVALKGLGAGREYMAKELRDIYEGGLDPRHFEIISRNMFKHVEVMDPGETSLLPGEKVAIDHIQPLLDIGAKEIPLHSARGKVLSRGVLTLTPGTYLDDNHIESLEHQGIKTVSVTGSGLKLRPLVPGLQSVKMLDPNWISKLSFSRLRDTLKESASVGAESDIHSTDPITSYIMGREFGQGENGKY